MAVINNTFTEIGDAAIVKTQFPVQGVAFFYSFEDSTEGVTNERYFKKEFRYSFDGILFSDWKEIENEVISFEIEANTGIMFLDFRYTREGTETEGFLSWSSVDFNVNVSRSFLRNIDNLTSSLYPTGEAWKSKPVVTEEVIIPVEEEGLQDELQSTIIG